MNILEIITALKKHNVIPRLANDQLKLIGETRHLPAALIEEVRAKREELRAFLMEAMDQRAYAPIPVVPAQQDYPSSNAQQRIWVLSRMNGGSAAYNIVRSFYLEGAVIVDYLDKAFQLAVRRHESLRTVFRETAGELRQVVIKDLPFAITFKDISTNDDIAGYLRSASSHSFSWKFDLVRGPLIRVELYRTGEKEYAMIFGIHHIISDGWSVGLLVREVMHAYEAFCKGIDPALLPLNIQYKDYCVWHHHKINGDKGVQAADFWKAQFSEMPDLLKLPADAPREAIRSFEGAVARYYPADTFYRSVLDCCAKNQVTSFNFFRTALMLLLNRLSGQSDIIIGTPASGRNHLDLEGQIGLYVNTLPLRAQVNPADTFLAFMKSIATHSIKAFEFQDYPFDKILEALDAPRDLSRNPLFDVMLVIQDAAVGEGSVNKHQQYGFELGLLDKYLYPSGRENDEQLPAKFDLTFNLDFEPDNRFYIEIEYDSRLFKKERIDRIFSSYLYVMEQAAMAPEMPMHQIAILSPEEKEKILTVFNQPVDDIAEESIIQLLATSFRDHKEKAAIITGSNVITYEALQRSSDHVAAFLLATREKIEHARVGLLMGRSGQVITCITGILKAGMAYVPVDITYPAERIAYIVRDAQLSTLLVDDEGMKVVPTDYGGRIIHISKLFATAVPLRYNTLPRKDLREHTAYIIYTSGSTGAPKGVEISHTNTIAFLKWAATEFASTPFEVLYATTSYCFDLSVFEFLFPLVQGKTIRMLASGLEIAAAVRHDQGIMINTVPSVVRSLLENGMDWRHVAALNMAGEPVPPHFKKELDYEGMEVRNLYGPTEDTTYSTMYRFAGDHAGVPIGNPVGYTQLYIMDACQQLLPPGVDGEIYLSGKSVAKGYLHQPALTAERFLDNPFVPGLRMYRTGDTGRWTENGLVEYTGRTDDQVKINGHRIEPGEIQYRLEQHAGVKQAVVMARKVGGENTLVAYVTGDASRTPALLKEYLATLLPSYMVPGYWVMLDEMPLNSNGKTDRKKLPLPEDAGIATSAVVNPSTGLHHQLLALWNEVLTTKVAGINDNFFEKGGHSLRATRLQFLIGKELGKEISLNEIFTAPTIELQAQLLETRPVTTSEVIPVVAEQEVYPISPAQERLWILTKFSEGSVAYNMPAVFRVNGKLDIAILEQAIKCVIERYEILRTVITEKDGVPVQRVLEPGSVDFSVEDVNRRHMNAGEALRWLRDKWKTPFDLENGPLLRCMLLHTQEETILYFDMHHIISDGWSLGILFEKIAAAYSLVLAGHANELPWPEMQYKDFAVWQRARLNSDAATSQRSFWMNMFREGVQPLELPFDFHRPEVKSYKGEAYHHAFTTAQQAKIRQLAQRGEASLFMTLMTLLRILLKKYTGQQDIVIGTPVSGRMHRQLQDQIGFYVNTLPVRLPVDSADDFPAMLQKEKEILLAAFTHQQFSFESLVDELQVKRDLSRAPLFDVMMVLQHPGEAGSETVNYLAPDLQLERITLSAGIAKYDLVFSFLENADGLSLSLEYNTDLFTEGTISRMVHHLDRIVDEVAASPVKRIADITLAAGEELAILHSKADQTHFSYDTTATITRLFREAVNKYPDRIALQVGSQHITYRELDTRSGQLARILVKKYAVQAEDFIILNIDRNEWMLIAILAVLKAGAAYVPVEPDAPLARSAYILENCGGRLILSDKDVSGEVKARLEGKLFINITKEEYRGEVLEQVVHPSSLAYVIYTSGTTGNPKGVLIEHRNVTRLLFHEGALFHFQATDRWSLFHSYSFDFSVWEMYGALLFGGTLVMVPKHVAQDGHAFYDFLKEENITVLNQTPTAFRSMLQANKERLTETTLPVRYLIFGGEALMPDILAPWKAAMPGCRIINMYGITETTVHVTYKEITINEINAGKSNIGMPIPTLSCYVLDGDLQQVPVGVTGELCVGGAGVARGYLNMPELTAAKFMDNPFRPGEKMYRSGDYARILPNGDIEYIGRRDDQVKIRGYRIGLNEVETAIRAQQNVKDVVVLPVKNGAGEYELVAYFIPVDPQEETGLLRKKLSDLLPAYMVPAYLIPLDQFPLNHNGKLDKAALPHFSGFMAAAATHLPSRNTTDDMILAIWEGVLERKVTGISDNFFDLGGNSLKATRVVSKIHETMGVRIDLKTLFTDPSIAHLSDYIETLRWMENSQQIMEGNEEEIVF